MQGILRFFQYNNAVPIAVSLVLLGAGGVFAATDPAAIYSSSEKVISIDNTYLANKDLSHYSPRIEITGVTEDGQDYYVAYKFYTMDVKDAIWQDVVKADTLKVSKNGLGPYGDLGLYATEQFKQLVSHEVSYLAEAQAAAQKNTSQKVVATSYGGLIGKLLDSSTETLAGYTPVVAPPIIPGVASGEQGSDSQTASAAAAGNLATGSAPQSPEVKTNATDSTGSLQVMGNDPSRIPMKTPYIDLGVFVSNPHYQAFTVKTFVNDAEVTSVQIDTSKVGTWHIRYEVTDDQDSAVSATRTVEVFDPYPPPASPAEATTSQAMSSETGSAVLAPEPTEAAAQTTSTSTAQ